ncbi:biotin synthase [Clostridiales bacterium PH28_bin88]|nr:biotin synthase [Clostridiales bacterium PH28_bin88]
MRKEFYNTLRLVAWGRELKREHLLTLLQADDEEERDLFSLADSIRDRYVGDKVHLRGIIEFSNHCRQDCLYCGLRRGNTWLARYRLEPGEILAIARRAAGLGYGTLVLQSGEDNWYSTQTLAELVYRIKQELDVAITLSVGERERADYKLWREAGADRYLMKHETADPYLFTSLRPGTTLAGRVQGLRWLRELGYQVGSGNMVGLPGQTPETLVDDLLLLRELDVEMAGIGPFIPNGQTPLADAPGGTAALTLRVLAVARLVLPWAHLPATTALGSIDAEGRQKALNCGANVVMPNVTPARYRERYQIYPNKICLQEEPDHCRGCVEGWVQALGREVATGHGHSPKAPFRNPRLPEKAIPG